MFYYYFQKWGGGGGGVKVCHLRHYMKKYRAIRLLVFSVKTLNVIRCARYVYVFLILWKTRKLRSLFQLKDKVDSKHCCNVVYEGTCSCGTNYIGITDRNASLRFDEHNNPKKSSEPAKHIKRKEGHVFTWTIVCRTPKYKLKGRILEAFFNKT